MNEKTADSSGAPQPARRRFFGQMVAVTSAVPLSQGLGGGAARVALKADAQSLVQAPAAAAAPTAAPVLGYQCFSIDESALVEAMVNLMCPKDEFTPNGVDCGLSNYIDRQLAGDYGRGVGMYMQGPWAQGKPELGYQLPLTPQEFFKAGAAAVEAACKAKYGKNLEQLAAADANAFLTDLAGGKVTHPDLPLGDWFNHLFYPLFTQACFADPMYGGNFNKVFWKMLGYPGLPALHAQDMVQFRGKPFPGAQSPKSIADFS